MQVKKRSTGAFSQRLVSVRAKAQETGRKVGPNPHRESGTKKLIVLGLGAAALCGPVALGQAALGSPAVSSVPAQSVAPVDPAAVVGEQTRAVAAAHNFLLNWMTASRADEEALASQLVTELPRMMLPDKAPQAPTSVIVADAQAQGAGTWLITFAVTGGAAGEGESYQVPVVVQGTSTGILAMPSRVGAAGLAQVKAPPLTALSKDAAASAAAIGFLKSWLTNAGDITRWTTPDFTPAPVTTQICEQVEPLDVMTDPSAADSLSAAEASASATPSTAATPMEGSTPDVITSGVVTATVTCTTGHLARPLTYRLTLTKVGPQLVVGSVNSYRNA